MILLRIGKEIARLKKDIGQKKLVQAGSTLLATERLRSDRGIPNKVPRGLSVSNRGDQLLRLLQVETTARTAKPL
jgi:hypothetical protein